MELQILIPQYNENEKVLAHLLDSIQLQQGVDFSSDIGVIIVNDGSTTFLSKDFLNKYNFPIEYHKDEHRGIAGTRNALLKYAKADYVMFCDADDMFGSMVAVYSIVRSIREGGFDELISFFYSEQFVQGVYIYAENDRVIHPFIHGKIFNRQYLIDNDIWFTDKVNYHEDVYFSFLAHSCATNIKLLQQFAYIWKHNFSSITHSDNFAIRHYTDSLTSIELVCEELISREKQEDACFYFTCCLYNSYFFMHQPSWLSQTGTDHWRNICIALKAMWEKHGQELFEDFDEEKRKGIWDDTVKTSIYSTGKTDESELEPFKDWLLEIVEKDYPEDDETID
jgi:glycosyltransferase involved in cell wall biosynthesis